MVGFNLAAATARRTSEAVAARFLVTTFKSGVGNVFVLSYFIGSLAGTLLMGIALWRSRSLPRWLPVLFVIGNVIAMFASAGIVSVPLSLPFTLAVVVLAVRIWRAPTPSAAGHLPQGPPLASRTIGCRCRSVGSVSGCGFVV